MSTKKTFKNFAWLLVLTLVVIVMPAAYAYADFSDVPPGVDYTYINESFTKIGVGSDLHLSGQMGQNNRPRFEEYLKGIQSFGPQIIILCGDQFEGNYVAPEENDYVAPPPDSQNWTDFTNPYDEIRALVAHYHPGIPIIFNCGNNDYTDEDNPDSYIDNTDYDSHFGLVETQNFDIFRFGAPSDGYSSYYRFRYSDEQIKALDYYLKNRQDKTKLVLITAHYPIDDGIWTPTNDSGSERNAGNADEVIYVLNKYDQPAIFLWGHNHDLGPEEKEHIIKEYPDETNPYRIYTTINAGGVAYRSTMEYTQGLDITLTPGANLIQYSMNRYENDGKESLLQGSLPIISGEPWTQGSGTEADPYQINKKEHLIYLAKTVNSGVSYTDEYFTQTADIDLGGINWTPIGKYVSSDGEPPDQNGTVPHENNRPFGGIYDGNGHMISNLSISETMDGTPVSNKGYGLFGYLTGVVRNLGLKGVDISISINGEYNAYAGGIAGYAGYYYAYEGKIENSFAEGEVSAETNGTGNDIRCAAGGLVGYLRSGEIVNSYSAVDSTINGGTNNSNSGAGGLAGWLTDNDDVRVDSSFWNIELTASAAGGKAVDSGGMDTVSMIEQGFVDILNEYGDPNWPSAFKLWMSDQYTSVNSGYPVYNRLINPVITTDPADVSSVNNKTGVEVTIVTSTTGATIYYTTDGSTPTAEPGNLYGEGGFTVWASGDGEETVTVKAISILDGEASGVTDKEIKFAAKVIPANPVITTDPTNVSSVNNKTGVEVTIGTSTPGAIIYYTTDGSTPTAEPGNLYGEGGFTVWASGDGEETVTVKAISILDGEVSAVTDKEIKFAAKVIPANPEITTDPTNVSSVNNKTGVVVTIGTSTPEAIIYYTTDGSTPTAEPGNLYGEGGFTVWASGDGEETVTVKAISILDGEASGVTDKVIKFAKAVTGGGGGFGGGGGIVALPLEIISKDLPDAVVGADYRLKLSAKGGSSKYSWTATGLPAGMEIDDEGNINGVPLTSGTYAIDVKVTDTDKQSVSAKLTIKVISLPASIFTDIDNHWAKAAILKASELGFVSGYGDQTFKPNRMVSRAECITMLVEAFGLEGQSNLTWSDIDSHWAKNYISIAKYHNIASGYSDKYFKPDEIITREQLSSLLIRLLKYDSTKGEAKFVDNDMISAWAVSDVFLAVDKGLMTGYPDNSFQPRKGTTRAEAVEAILNARSLMGL